MSANFKHKFEGWLDARTGLLWLPIESERYTFDAAIKTFNTPMKRLPTKEEWEVAEQHNIRKMFSDFNDRWFLSSTPYPYGPNVAWVFDGNDGFVDHVSLYHDLHSVRCLCDIRDLEFNNRLNELIK